MALAEAPIDSADEPLSSQEILIALDEFMEAVQADLDKRFADFNEQKNKFFDLHMAEYVSRVTELVQAYQVEAPNKSVDTALHQAIETTDDLKLSWPSSPDTQKPNSEGIIYRMNRQPSFFTKIQQALSKKSFPRESLDFSSRIKALLRDAQRERGIPVPA